MAQQNSMPPVTPYLTVKGASDAIEFYKKAFGAVEESRLPGPDGKLLHAQVRINGDAVMLTDEMPNCGAVGPLALKGTPVTLHLYVKDVDATVASASAAGAKVTRPVEDQFYGDRSGTIEDPFGQVWTISTHVEDVPLDEMAKRMAAFTSS